MAEAFIYALHGDALRALSDVLGHHYEGLQAAGRAAKKLGLINNQLFKRLTIVDHAFTLQGHVTKARTKQVLQELDESLSSCRVASTSSSWSSTPVPPLSGAGLSDSASPLSSRKTTSTASPSPSSSRSSTLSSSPASRLDSSVLQPSAPWVHRLPLLPDVFDIGDATCDAQAQTDSNLSNTAVVSDPCELAIAATTHANTFLDTIHLLSRVRLDMIRLECFDAPQDNLNHILTDHLAMNYLHIQEANHLDHDYLENLLSLVVDFARCSTCATHLQRRDGVPIAMLLEMRFTDDDLDVLDDSDLKDVGLDNLLEQVMPATLKFFEHLDV